MHPWRSLAPCTILFCTLAVAATGQSAITVHEAELAVPFGSTPGHLALTGSQIVFVSPETPDASIAIDRADIASVDRAGDVVTVVTRQVLRGATGARDTFRFKLSRSADLVTWYEETPVSRPAAPAMDAPSESRVLASYKVKHDHRIGNCEGQLLLMTDRVSYESVDDINDSQQWLHADIEEVEQDGIYKLKVEPFFGDTYNFELAGKGMDSGEFRALVERIARARSSQ